MIVHILEPSIAMALEGLVWLKLNALLISRSSEASMMQLLLLYVPL